MNTISTMPNVFRTLTKLNALVLGWRECACVCGVCFVYAVLHGCAMVFELHLFLILNLKAAKRFAHR